MNTKILTLLSLLITPLAQAITPEPGLYGGTLRTSEDGDPVAFLRVQVGRSGGATARIYWKDGSTEILRGKAPSIRADRPGVRLDFAPGWDYLPTNYTVNLWQNNRWLRGNLFPATDKRPIKFERVLVGEERGQVIEFSTRRSNAIRSISLTTTQGTRAWVGPERRTAFSREMLTLISGSLDSPPVVSWRDLPPWPARYRRPAILPSPDYEPTLPDPINLWELEDGQKIIAGFEPMQILSSHSQ